MLSEIIHHRHNRLAPKKIYGGVSLWVTAYLYNSFSKTCECGGKVSRNCGFSYSALSVNGYFYHKSIRAKARSSFL